MMPDEMEEMEARLAAYIDGTLPADQRAEIEAYLKANGSHARLIRELQSLRTAVAGLPTERAPAEVLDSLQAHLERHTLLDGVEHSAAPMRINRWPQLSVVAAVLLLAAGLGFLVYQVIPNGRPSANDLAMLTSSATRPTADGDAAGVTLEPATANVAPSNADEASAGVEAKKGAKIRPDAPKDQSVAGQVSQQQQTAAKPGDGTEAAPQFNDAIAALPPETRTQKASEAGPATRPVNVLIVTSDDPALTANLVAGGLAQNGTRTEREAVVDATTTASRPAADRRFDALTRQLQADGDLPAGDPASLLAARPVVVPAASTRSRGTVQALIETQRPGRQKWRNASKLDDGLRFAVATTTRPATPSADIPRADRQAAAPATSPTTVPTAVSPDTPGVADLVVLFVNVPPATRPTPEAARLPAFPATQPTTSPATLPAGDEVP